MKGIRWLAMLAFGFGLAACGGASVVATAADHELSVDELVGMLSGGTEIQPSRAVVTQLADLWIDYTLLARAAAEDPSMLQVDVSPWVDQRVEQEMAVGLRQSALQLDTALTADELQQAYDRDARDSEVRIRHLLLTWPDRSTPAQRDSVRAAVQSLRDRIVGSGESFATLAQRFSQDYEYAASGGDTGYFPRGQMIDAVDQAAFALQPGEVSAPVESPLGVHLIRVEGRRTPSVADFRGRLQAQRVTQAVAEYVVTLEARALPEATEDAFEILRSIARYPRAPINGVSEGRAIVEYRGGTITVAEARQFLHSRTAPVRAQIAGAPEGDLRVSVLRPLVQGALLRSAAEEAGVAIPEERVDALTAEARATLRQAAEQAGLISPGDGGPEAIQAAVGDLLASIVQQEREVVPLGPYAYLLARQYTGSISDTGVTAALERLRLLREVG